MKNATKTNSPLAIWLRTPKRLRVVTAYAVLGGLSIVAGVAVACAPMAPIVPTAGKGTLSTSPAAKGPAAKSTPTVKSERAGVLGGRDRVALIALAGKMPVARISATGSWQINERGGRTLLVRGSGAEPWQVERKGGLLRITGAGGDATPWREGPFVATTSNNNTYVQFGGKRYRGELWFTATDTGV
ncbi:MAG: hypothetical protein ABI852_15175, partial [Gemmatimonadaceae bacterium]